MIAGHDFFKACEICGGDGWKIVYAGPVRDGAFGNLTDDGARVARCGGCGVERLDEEHCKEEEFYKGESYRELLKKPTDAAGFFAEHDVVQLRNLEQLWPESVRGKVVADVGCGAGSFLDHIAGLASEVIAIDPCEPYHEFLASRGYKVYPLAKDAAAEPAGPVDWAFSFSVVEHVPNPRSFLEDIGKLLKPDGRLMVSTPNRRDLLMEILPDDYQPFFYRAVHRWYFDIPSFSACADRAGLEVIEIRVHQRFGLSNTMLWLRDRQPRGSKALPHIRSDLLDHLWRSYLEREGVGDYLYFVLRREP